MEQTLASADSHSGVPVRLTYERWGHIVEAHDYMAGLYDWVLETVADPDALVAGWAGSIVATRHYPYTPITEKYLIVIYRELSTIDGFVITAFLTSKIEKVWKRGILWQRSK